MASSSPLVSRFSHEICFLRPACLVKIESFQCPDSKDWMVPGVLDGLNASGKEPRRRELPVRGLRGIASHQQPVKANLWRLLQKVSCFPRSPTTVQLGRLCWGRLRVENWAARGALPDCHLCRRQGFSRKVLLLPSDGKYVI